VLRKWITPRAFLLHLLLVCIVSGCLIAARWQLHSALGGNTLSWAYTVEWPVFAVIAVVGWWQLIHELPKDRAERTAKARQGPEVGELAGPLALGAGPGPDEDLAAAQAARVALAAAEEYRAYLAEIEERDSELRSRRRSRTAT
jgi:hypothetical protein